MHIPGSCYLRDDFKSLTLVEATQLQETLMLKLLEQPETQTKPVEWYAQELNFISKMLLDETTLPLG